MALPLLPAAARRPGGLRLHGRAGRVQESAQAAAAARNGLLDARRPGLCRRPQPVRGQARSATRMRTVSPAASTPCTSSRRWTATTAIRRKASIGRSAPGLLRRDRRALRRRAGGGAGRCPSGLADRAGRARSSRSIRPACRSAPNIHYLGQQPYEALPHFLAGWDVCLLPFALNEATRFISPTKVLEYMAAELPIVSTPITDVAVPYGEWWPSPTRPRNSSPPASAALAMHAGAARRRWPPGCARWSPPPPGTRPPTDARSCWKARRRRAWRAAPQDGARGDAAAPGASARSIRCVRQARRRPCPAPDHRRRPDRPVRRLSPGRRYRCCWSKTPPWAAGAARSRTTASRSTMPATSCFPTTPTCSRLYDILLGDNLHWQNREAWVYSKKVTPAIRSRARCTACRRTSSRNASSAPSKRASAA